MLKNQSDSPDLRIESSRRKMSKQLKRQGLFLKTGIRQKFEWVISILLKQSSKT